MKEDSKNELVYFLKEKREAYKKKKEEPFLNVLKKCEYESVFNECQKILDHIRNEDFDGFRSFLNNRLFQCEKFLEGDYTPEDMKTSYRAKIKLINNLKDYLDER